MTAATSRYPIKPKTLTLLELCQSISDFRRPPPSVSSYQSHSSITASQILTRRLYLHPLTINSSSKQQSAKHSTNITAVTSPDGEQRHQSNRDTHHTNNKSSHHGLAILSSSFPLTSRTNPKPEIRHSRDKTSIKSDDDTNSDYDSCAATVAFNQASYLSIARGTTSSTHTKCTRPSCVKNHQKIYPKVKRWEKVDVWNHFDRALQRPIPIDPPTTPLSVTSDIITETDETQDQYSDYNSIQQIKICKRNPILNSSIEENDDDDDDYIYNEDQVI
jgi:hypothetical protein